MCRADARADGAAEPAHRLRRDEEQQQRYLPERPRATKGAFCLTEPDHGSDAAALETRAVRDGDDYVLNGNKVYISGGTVADYLRCSRARVGRGRRASARSWWMRTRRA